MYHRKTLTIVMPAYNEEPNISAAVREYRAIPEVDEVVVVNNNSRDRTGEEALSAGARVVNETQQGYGYACRRGLIEAKGDLVALVEPDGTFLASDLRKFLAYIDEFDVVFGTRTSRACIWEGANMGFALRYGNVLVAKFLEYLHNGPCLSDVGCTFKMFTREAIDAVKDYFTVGKSHFSPELMILCVRRKLRCIEIPVHYGPRVGDSKITGDIKRAIRLGMIMIGLILKYRFKRIPRVQPSALWCDAYALAESENPTANLEDRPAGARLEGPAFGVRPWPNRPARDRALPCSGSAITATSSASTAT
jgi:glycosyltransferase involved in cell wall biosynthesis